MNLARALFFCWMASAAAAASSSLVGSGGVASAVGETGFEGGFSVGAAGGFFATGFALDLHPEIGTMANAAITAIAHRPLGASKRISQSWLSRVNGDECLERVIGPSLSLGRGAA